MSALRVLVIGDGKMGRAVAELAASRDAELVGLVHENENRDGAAITAERAAGADVAIEFTEPGAAPANVIACARARLPIVVGTTGWYDRLGEVREVVEREGSALLYAPNFSLGVNLFLALARQAGAAFASVPDFDVHIVETHHRAKKDAPSGTALALQRETMGSLGRDVPVTSVRTGSVPGTHELIFDGPFEQLRLVHEARDRRVFADGALTAAHWLRGRRGVFTMADVLAGNPR
jgi:4-hydroxy-tetrahydrodipicolinate reductase